jgi:hypothetical protein
VKLVLFERKILPAFFKEMQLDENEIADIMDEFSLFLLNVSEVAWLKGKQNILMFQKVIRRYRKKTRCMEWDLILPGIIEDLVRYTQADKNVLPPFIQSGGKAGLLSLWSQFPFLAPLYDFYLRHSKKKKAYVAGLLPRIAMLPLRHVCYFEDDAVKIIDRELIENHIGGIAVARQPDNRLVIAT